MHYPDSRWRPRCQGESRDDVSGRICELGEHFSLQAISACYQICSWSIWYPKIPSNCYMNSMDYGLYQISSGSTPTLEG